MSTIASANPSHPGGQSVPCVRGIGPEHFAQLYERDSFLIDTVSHLIAEGLEAGDAGVIIATHLHRNGIEHRLRERGLDLDRLGEQGRYVALDAAETMSRFIVDGWPDQRRFDEVVGNTIRHASQESSPRHVQAFGEMVALLWAGQA